MDLKAQLFLSKVEQQSGNPTLLCFVYEFQIMTHFQNQAMQKVYKHVPTLLDKIK